MLDLPFGGAAEIGREGDSQDGRVLWIELIDAATLFPTNNHDWPVGQMVEGYIEKPVFFPAHAINRVYMSPRTEMKRKGWGMAPPEKIYLAIEMINRGDIYYANLLLDTPEAGLLDLGDMAKASAEEWVKSFREMLTGIDGFKIPVLYEHTNPVSWIPFGRPPTDMMFGAITTKYASVVAAGYGMSLSDIGISMQSSGGETLAGTIRQERQTRRSGFARVKKKMKMFFDRLLPPELEYKLVDQDDELSIAMGRARLATATALGQLINLGVLSPQEGRQQFIADGLVSISLPEKIPEDAVASENNGKPAERPSMLGRPIAPSMGGHGEVLPSKSDAMTNEINRLIGTEDIRLRRLIKASVTPLLTAVRSETVDADWDNWLNEIVWGDTFEEIPELIVSNVSDAKKNILDSMFGDKWWDIHIEELSQDLEDTFSYAVNQILLSRAEESYERGDTNELPDKVEPQEDLLPLFRSAIAVSTDEAPDKVKELIAFSVINGVKSYILDKERSISEKTLDTKQLMVDNVTVQYVRNEIVKSLSAFVQEYADKISGIIKQILERV